ncbi:MAG: ComF family protein [Oscillospiraceae bacterium]|nr:ComF family protein [Oscillospiraceae bacterium]
MDPATRLLDRLFPPKCIFCRKVSDINEYGSCSRCSAALPRSGHFSIPAAPSCSAACAPYHYAGAVRSALLRFKFSRRKGYARFFARAMADSVRSDIKGRIDCITWVPLSRARLRKRGYDQARCLAEELSKELNIPCAPLLEKIKDVRPQSSLSRKERLTNLSGVFRAISPFQAKDASVLLVDDIITTGSTVAAASGVLKKAGVRVIFAVSAARD